ncbi:hypothetical protein Q5P01_003420 [Channa striata]|uniref:Ig-like domain-containing protein n=1 Tax=Channa striata TaxID=64152 RepID=A0AA88NSG5_CHASR|nr:hypothetical protein Q5P01_003420 [Channa striata]
MDGNGYKSSLSRVLLLLFLAGFQPGPSSAEEHPEQHADGLNATILGPDYVTVGVPSSAECYSSCSNCTFSMSVDGQSVKGHGNVVAFTVVRWMDVLTITCTVTANNPALNVTATKQVQVLAGPANIFITGPDFINSTMSYNYSCHADCQPLCTYTWKTLHSPWIPGEGNMISITPHEIISPELLICKATNSVSRLFVTATKEITIASGPSEVRIDGPDLIEIGKNYKFVCTADCRPTCVYVLSVGDKIVGGDVIEMTVDELLKSVTLKCAAQNPASGKLATAVKSVEITERETKKGSERNLSARTEKASAVLLLAFITSAALTM